MSSRVLDSVHAAVTRVLGECVCQEITVTPTDRYGVFNVEVSDPELTVSPQEFHERLRKAILRATRDNA